LIITPQYLQKLHKQKIYEVLDKKKYKRLKKFLFSDRVSYDPITFQPITITNKLLLDSQRNLQKGSFNNLHKISTTTDLKENLVKNKMVLSTKINNLNGNIDYVQLELTKNVINDLKTDLSSNSFNFYNAIKNNRHRSELLSVTLARRLLRTKRTLVLPAHVNITVITNSYDVVHS